LRVSIALAMNGRVHAELVETKSISIFLFPLGLLALAFGQGIDIGQVKSSRFLASENFSSILFYNV